MKTRTKRIEYIETQKALLHLEQISSSKIVNKSLKIEQDIAKKIKLGGALINKSQGEFIAFLVRDFFEKHKAKELGKILDDINKGKLKTSE